MRRQGYYEGGTCDATVRGLEDGEAFGCRKRGVHPYLPVRPLWNYFLNEEAQGPSRRFLCDQHFAEHLAGQDIGDPMRPRMKKAKALAI